MDILSQLETAVDQLLQKNRELVEENSQLLSRQNAWEAERQRLVGEIDRLLQRVASVMEDQS